MDSSEARLVNIEAQRSKDDQRKRRYFPINLINKVARRFSFRGFLPCVGDDATPPTGDTEVDATFLTNLISTDLYNLPGEYVVMDSKTLSAMRAGNRGFLERMKSYETPLACFKNKKGDTILHLAASFGHLELVKMIVYKCPSLLLELNFKYQIPLHVAACSGQLAVVKALVAWITFFSDRLAEEGWERWENLNPCVLKDKDGNTPLHLTMKELHEKTEMLRSRSSNSSSGTIKHGLMDTVIYLVTAEKHASFLANKDGISPLYMAVEAGNEFLVCTMLNTSSSDLASQLEGRKSLVHAALKAKNEAILVGILNKDRSLADKRDEKGKTCLSVGASVGYYKGVCCLLDRSYDQIFVSDDDGFFPIHMAAKYGHLEILREILKRHRDAIELVNSNNGQQILHVAAENGQHKAIKFILRCFNYGYKMEKLINEQDADGNTPLHLATENAHPKVVSMLTWDEKVDVRLRNCKNKTALDIAEQNIKRSDNMLEILTWIFVVPAAAPDLSDKAVKELINTLLLVATIVATMTFNAGFALPGGYNGSDPNLGMAALAKKKAFQVFLVFNTLAMYSSIIMIVALIWAQLGHPSLRKKALTLSLPLLGISITFMSIAFMSGTSAAVSHIPLLPYFILGTGVIYLVVFLLIIIPYVYPKLLTNPFLRYIFYSPYFLLLWAVGDHMLIYD